MTLNRKILALAFGVAMTPAFTSNAKAQPPFTAAASKPVKSFVIKSLSIGEGRPKTIVPITGNTAALAIEQASKIAANPAADVIEWRIDYLDIATNAPDLIKLGKQVMQVASTKPVILTFRTKAEGGATSITDADYGRLIGQLIKARVADMVDVEMFRDEAVVKSIVVQAHEARIKVVMSNHDFTATPSTDEIIFRLRRQDDLGADVLKIAVMPKDAGDVLKLLSATWAMRSQYTDKPLLTMSMGGPGVTSRLGGETFGSSLTFGMMGTASAPGQIDVQTLQSILEVIHNAQPKEQ